MSDNAEQALKVERLTSAWDSWQKRKAEYEEVCVLVRDLHHNYGFTLGKLADILGVSRQNINYIIQKGKRDE